MTLEAPARFRGQTPGLIFRAASKERPDGDCAAGPPLSLTIPAHTGSVFALPSIGTNIISADCPGSTPCTFSTTINLGPSELFGIEYDSIGFTGQYDFTLKL